MNPSQILDQMIADPSINGQHVDIDKQFGGQCWDLVELFAERCGVPKEPWAITLGPLGGAKEAWTVFDSHMQRYFDKIPAGQQQKGDITVYDGHGPYIYGHIAISLGGNSVFEENADPDGSPAHVYDNRSSTYLLGALRLKGVIMASQDKVDETTIRLEYNGVLFRDASTAEIKQWLDSGVTVEQFQRSLLASPEYAKIRTQWAAGKDSTAVVLKPGKYQVN